MTNASLRANAALAPTPRWRERLSDWTPRLVLAPSLIASFVYVFLFTILDALHLAVQQHSCCRPMRSSASSTTSNSGRTSAGRSPTATSSSSAASMSFSRSRSASRSRSRSTSACAAKSFWRTIFLYPLAVSFVVTGTVWSWLYSPNAGIEFFVRSLGWTDFTFRLTTNRDTAIYAIIATGVWQSSGFAMALFLAGLRSVDPGLDQGRANRRRQPLSHLSKGDPAHDRADLRRGRRRTAAVRDQDLRSRGRADRRRPRHRDDVSRRLTSTI